MTPPSAKPRLPWSQNLSARVGRWSMLVAMVCLTMVSSVQLWLAYDAERTNAHRLLEKNGEKVALLVSSYTEEITSTMGFVESTAARSPGLVPGPALVAWRRDILEASLTVPRSPFAQMTLLDSTGREILHVSRFHTYLEGELVSRAGDAGFMAAREGRTFLSPVGISPDSGLLSMQIAVPFHAPDLHGVLAAEANVSRLWMDVSRIDIGRGGYAYLVDGQGRFLAYHEVSQVLNRHGEDMRGMPPVAAFVAGAAIGTEPRARSYRGLSGEQVVGLEVPIANTEWAVVVEIPEAEAFASTRRMVKLLVAFGLLGVVLAGVAGMLVSRRLLRPIEVLTAAARRIGAGDLKTPIARQNLQGNRADEVGALTEAFRKMQVELVDLWASLEHQLAELTRAQTALFISEERYRTIFENSGSALAIVDKDDAIGMVNREFEKLTGWSQDDLTGRAFSGLIAERDRARMIGYRNGRTHGPAEGPRTYEFAVVDRKGQVREVASSVVTIADGQVLASLLDITNLRKAERDREHSERKLQAIFNGSFQFMGLLGTDGTLLEVNRKAAEFAGLGRDDLIGRPFWETQWWSHSREQQAKLRREMARAVKGEFVRFESTFVDVHGEARFIDVSLTPVTDESGRVTLVIPEGRDITELRRHQEQLRQSQKMETVGQLAGGVAHDFNNLLTAIYGNVEMAMAQTGGSDPRHGYLAEIRRAAQSAERLTTQLLAFSRKQRLDPQELDLNECVGAFCKMVGRLIGERIRLEFCPAPSPCHVRIDATMIEQIVINIAVNARDAMPCGGRLRIELENRVLDAASCKAHPRLSPGEHVVLAISDTGVGIPPEVQTRIFEPFFTTKPAGKGTGLGLAIVLTAVEQCAGSIEVDSSPGRGSTFRLFFPRLRDASSAATTTGPSELPRGAESILLVEDNSLICATTVRILEMLGYRVVAAESAEAAIHQLSGWRGPLDLLFTDVVLPGMDGPSLADRLVQSRPTLKTLFTSGYNDNVSLAEGLAQKRVHFLPKPYDALALARAVRAALEVGP